MLALDPFTEIRGRSHFLKRYTCALLFSVGVGSVLLTVAATYYSDPAISREGRIAVHSFVSEGVPKEQVLDGTLVGEDGKPVRCEQTYDLFPCSNTLGGCLFLTLVYGAILMFAAQCIGDGGEVLLDLEVLPPSTIGGVILPILGAVPDAAIIVVSALGAGSVQEAEQEISVGLGTLAGSTIMLLTIAYTSSLWVGRCDLVDGEALDETLDGAAWEPKYSDSNTRWGDVCRHSFTTGVSHSPGVLRIKWFMLGSSLCYLVVQVPASLYPDDPAFVCSSCLAGVVVCVVVLVLYLIDSAQHEEECAVSDKATLKGEIKVGKLMQKWAKHMESGGTPGRKPPELFRTDGKVNRETIASMFDAFDLDKNGFLDTKETDRFINVVFKSSGEEGVPLTVQQQLEDARQASQVHIISDSMDPKGSTGSCFSKGIIQPKEEPHESLINKESFLDKFVQLLESPEFAEASKPEVMSEVEVHAPEHGMGHAFFLILLGVALAAVFSDCVVDTINSVGRLTGIPNFVIGFVVCPLASNASELISSIQLAARKKKRNATVSFAQIYAACTMNNCLCLGIFFFMVWYKKLKWDYAAEVTSILAVTWVVGLCTMSNTTISLWVGWCVLLLYPLSLVIIEGLQALGVP